MQNSNIENTVKPIPDGHHTVTPYLVMQDPAKFISFLTSAFGAVETARFATPDGIIRHAEVRIGDSVIMIGGAVEKPQNGMLHLYVPDTDAVYRRAIQAGAKSLREPADQIHGDRSAGVEDAWGNTWWMATHVEDVSVEEIERRMRGQK